jgi:hypothetical protein
MRRVDLMDDPRFSSAAARRLNFGALHQIIQSWILTFPDMARLDAQFDEAKIAMGEIRSIKQLTKSDWSEYWGAVQFVPDRCGGEYKLPGRPWHFSRDELTPIGTPAFQGEHNREVFRELGVSGGLQRLPDGKPSPPSRRAGGRGQAKGACGSGSVTAAPSPASETIHHRKRESMVPTISDREHEAMTGDTPKRSLLQQGMLDRRAMEMVSDRWSLAATGAWLTAQAVRQFQYYLGVRQTFSTRS